MPTDTPAAEVTTAHRVFSRLTDRFVTVTGVTRTGRKAWGTDVPVLAATQSIETADPEEF